MRIGRIILVYILPFLFIVGGLTYLLWPKVEASTLQQAGKAQNRSLLASSTKTLNHTGTMPAIDAITHISLPRLHIQLDVKNGYYNAAAQTWTLNDTHAFFIAEAATPFIYGHAIPAVFGKLQGIATDEILEVTTSQQTLLFSFTNDVTIAADHTAILRHQAPDSILLMTCTGQTFEQRRVMQFEYRGAKDAVR